MMQCFNKLFNNTWNIFLLIFLSLLIQPLGAAEPTDIELGNNSVLDASEDPTHISLDDNMVDETLPVETTAGSLAPTDIWLDDNTVDENRPVETTIGSLITIDPDVGDTHTYSLVTGTGDTDNASFTIDGDQLKTAESFDFETQNQYSIRVQTQDSAGNTYQKPFMISITDVNEDPSDISLDDNTVDEKLPVETTVGSLITIDPDVGDTHTYSLVTGTGDTDNASFTIDGDQLKTAESFDFETQNQYSIRVQTQDSAGNTYQKPFVISIIDVNDNPVDIILDSDSVEENAPIGELVGTLSTDVPESGDTYTYSLVAGAGDTDNASFIIDGDQLKTTESFDFETKEQYSIRVQTQDSAGNTYQKPFVISIIDVNEAPTDITLDNNSVDENALADTTVGLFTTTDPDTGDTYTYSLVAGAGSTDNASFTIDGDELKTDGSFDFEDQPQYSIRVQTQDAAANIFEEIFTILVIDVNENPEDIILSKDLVAENEPAGTTVGILATTDPDTGDTHTYSLVAGAGSTDNASFTIDGDELKTASPFDFEAKNQYNIRVQTRDSIGNTYQEVFTINVKNISDYLFLPFVKKSYCPDASEPINNEFSGAIDLAPNTQITSSFCDNDPRDRYKLMPASSGQTSIQLRNVPAGADIDLFLYNVSGTQIAVSSSGLFGEDESIVHNLNAGETYYLSVSLFQELGTRPYIYSLQWTQPLRENIDMQFESDFASTSYSLIDPRLLQSGN